MVRLDRCRIYFFINHLCYADDLCLISLSSSGICNTCLIFVMSMQPLINYYIMSQSHFH